MKQAQCACDFSSLSFVPSDDDDVVNDARDKKSRGRLIVEVISECRWHCAGAEEDEILREMLQVRPNGLQIQC